MARKNVDKILSGTLLALCIVFFCTIDGSSQSFVGGKMKFAVSGSTGTGNVLLKGLGTGGFVSSDSSGNYSVEIEYGWSGVVTPEKPGFTFEPSNLKIGPVKGPITGKDFTAKPITFTISGSVGDAGAGVKLADLPSGPVVSDAKGQYTATVEFGWNGKIMPIKDGFVFTPDQKPYTDVKQNFSNQNYTAKPVTYTIAGSVGVPGVRMEGLPGNVISGATGAYSVAVSHKWKGKVTPKLEGYNFSPQEREYSEVTSDQLNQDFIQEQIMYTISGSAGMQGVTMNGLPGNVISGAGGYYTATVPHGFNGTVTPTLDGYVFKDATKTYSKVTGDLSDQNYEASIMTLTITGSAGAPDVTMNGLPGNPVSDANGSYRVTVDYNFSGTITPTKDGYRFSPPNQIYNSLHQNQVQDYKAEAITYTISGSAGQPGVTLQGLPGTPVVSGADNRYTARVPWSWNGTIKPVKEGFSFEPPERPYSQVLSDLPSEDYTASLLTFKISGIISSDTGPAADVLVVADLNKTATTNAQGEYELTVNYGWTGMVKPSKPGLDLTPASRPYSSMKTDMTGQNYNAKIQMRTISGAVNIGGTAVEGVTITPNPNPVGTSTVTDTQGKYTVQVPYGWTGVLEATKEGWQFDPAYFPRYENVTENQIGTRPESEVVPPHRIEPVTTLPPVTAGPEKTAIQPAPPAPGKEPVTGSLGPADTLQGQVNALQEKIKELIEQKTGGRAGTGVPGPNMPPGVLQQFPSKYFPVPAGPIVDVVFVETNLTQALSELSAQAGVKIDSDGTIKNTVNVRERNVPLERALDVIAQTLDCAVKKEPDSSYLFYTPITNSFTDTSIRQALQDIAVMVGAVVIPEESVEGTISCSFENVPIGTAIEMALAGTPYVVQKKENYYLVGPGTPTSPIFSALSETHNLKLNYIAADTAVSLLSPAFTAYVKAETSTHTVCITAPTGLANRIISDLKKIDQPPRHVLLDARIVIMERGDLLNLGVEWGMPKMRAGIYGNNNYGWGNTLTDYRGNWPWGVQIGYSPDGTFTDSLLLALNMLRENGEADIVATPQVMAQDGRPAEISVMSEEYYMMTAPQTQTNSYGYYGTSTFQTVTSGTRLNITPRIGENGDITLTMAVEVSDSIPNGRVSDLPVVTRRTATNSVRVKDGGTAALAGLTENVNRSKIKRVPGFSSLPLIGKLFQNTETDKSTREVAVFITAHLVPQMEDSVQGESAQPPVLRPVSRPTAPVLTVPPARAAAPAQPMTESPNESFENSLRRNLYTPPSGPREVPPAGVTTPRPSEPSDEAFEKLLMENLNR